MKIVSQRLLKLCAFHNLCITNSYFETKPQHKVSCIQGTGTNWTWFWLGLLLLHTRSYHSADCDTDHSLVCCKIRLQPKTFHRSKKPGNPRIDVIKMSQPDLVEQFAEAFVKEYDPPQPGDSATEKWESLQDRNGRNITPTSTPERTSCRPQRFMPTNAYHSWKS